MFSSNTSSAAGDANYIEDVFSTWLYTGNGSTQTITNGIDLAGKGGLVWIKDRNSGAKGHALFDTARGVNKKLQSQSTNGEFSSPNQLTAFNATGFDLGSATDPNGSGTTYASWTFREQPKFFDVVTYTGNGSSITVNHNLGSVPGMIIVKNLSQSDSWLVWHRSMSGFAPYMFLDETLAVQNNGGISSVSSTSFTYPWSFSTGNGNGLQYIAYVFAHNAGGFGLTGTDNVVSCGSFTTDGSGNASVTLGYEPQWILYKESSNTGENWSIADTMRGMPVTGNVLELFPNNASSESTAGISVRPNATGFTFGPGWSASRTFIYIAIRRGPMKVPTTGTSVFTPVSTSGNVTSITSGFPVDFALGKEIKNSTSYGNYAIDRLRGGTVLLETNTTGVEYTSQTFKFDSNTQFLQSGGGLFYGPSIYWNFRRAPGFFDEVCYTGTGSATTVAHNLAAVPELMIIKGRSYVEDWAVYSASLPNTQALRLNSAGSPITNSLYWNSTTPTSSVFTVGTRVEVNNSGGSIVAYLFATCPGVSKVGSYTGNGSSQTINCGFTNGARFVMIKRTDNTGDWYVWDTARGIVSGNDPHLSLNSTAAEVTSNDTIDTDSTGFVVNQVSATNVNVSSATYIFLAIA